MRATRALGKFLRPYWHWALLAPLLMVLEVAMDLLQPWLIQHIIDNGVAAGDLAYVLRTGAIMAGVAVIGMIGGVGCTIFAVLAAQGFGADLRQALYAKIQTFSFANLDELDTGALITRLTNDVTQGRELVQHGGVLARLGGAMCKWAGGGESPDRLDALAWALTELMLSRRPAREAASYQG